MSDKELDSLARTMAGVLRHFPERYGLDMDDHGFVDLRDFITAIQIRNKKFRFLKPHHVLGVIETDAKGRYEFREGKIRATYAHSFDVDLDLPVDNIPDILYYPTTEEECPILLEIGLKPSDRKMVHLSHSYEDAMEAGKVRTDDPIILEVDTEKAQNQEVVIMKAGKTVYVTKETPPDCLSKAKKR
ncbi:MAG: RNA 2'-phosphotransferase [Methanobacteriota archaeon]|nr:MAG: RNA 2'-phosphotransferase [Euryarchaeota archaeon]